MRGESHRHHRRRRDRRVERGELANGPLELDTVVPARAEHDLRVHPDPGARQPCHERHEVAFHARLPQQPVAELGIGGVHRDIER